jgi:hypothetical protein
MLLHERMSVARGGIGLAPLGAPSSGSSPRSRSTWRSKVGAIAQRLVDRDFTGKAVMRIR